MCLLYAAVIGGWDGGGAARNICGHRCDNRMECKKGAVINNNCIVCYALIKTIAY